MVATVSPAGDDRVFAQPQVDFGLAALEVRSDVVHARQLLQAGSEIGAQAAQHFHLVADNLHLDRGRPLAQHSFERGLV